MRAKDLQTILFDFADSAKQEIEDFGEHTTIGRDAARAYITCKALIMSAGLEREYEARKQDLTMKEYGQLKRTVTLTEDQWNRLTTYLLMSTRYREGERDSWIELSKETNDDGTPVFQNAAGNAEFWKETIDVLEQIRRTIDAI